MIHHRADSPFKTDVPQGLQGAPHGAPIGAGKIIFVDDLAIIITDRMTALEFVRLFRKKGSHPAQ